MNERVDFFYTSDIQNKNKKEQKNKHQPWAFTAPDAHVHTVQTSRIQVFNSIQPTDQAEEYLIDS